MIENNLITMTIIIVIIVIFEDYSAYYLTNETKNYYYC